ncbi:DUF493 domain-containing protein [Ketobacter sp. MCCC 1A13808]|uniref:YbeD family protein n=1 Tax=Ketobacter sp. MCCC 1A13808 TaxID=2602738 RepID=UPI000F27AEFA|nr:DUF493 domain-containing protein [Ketobacter sp. MCCC 1A13808]MVF13348.1 DUF493 domain-containing protein [Ketobacter sp. MCCC 1A13808]RLP54329.1 MAG: DUF493 domain-containing protein [Ketobacter sp.]
MGIQEHLWDFPCVHSVKIVGLSEYPLVDVVTEVVSRHAPDFDRASIRARQSGAGKYTAVTVDVHFTHKEQVEALFQELHERPEIHLTL